MNFNAALSRIPYTIPGLLKHNVAIFLVLSTYDRMVCSSDLIETFDLGTNRAITELLPSFRFFS